MVFFVTLQKHLQLTAITKKVLSYLFKAVLLVLALIFIYFEYLKKGDNLKQFEHLLSTLNIVYVTITLTSVFLLMLVNWLLESMKWQYLAKHLLNISLWQSIEGVFCGLTWAIFTPNRVGEFGGRLMFLPPRKRIHGFFAMAVGAFGQLAATLILGIISTLWFYYTFLDLTMWAFEGATLLGLFSIAIILIAYFNIKWLVWLLDAIPFLKKFHRFFKVMASYKFAELLKIMWYCLFRFSIFLLQYYLIIHLLIPQIAFYEVVLLVCVVLFARSILPSIDIIDVALRSAVATSIFGYVTHQDVAIVACFTAIWFVNLIVPAILGSVFIFKLKFFDRNS